MPLCGAACRHTLLIGPNDESGQQSEKHAVTCTYTREGPNDESGQQSEKHAVTCTYTREGRACRVQCLVDTRLSISPNIEISILLSVARRYMSTHFTNRA
ncbi:hypothetical protein J6590_015388 [Homalodisca vitripennis]|nr:hypothetical protein J6590_015388 [Homalodisca vitripennis]